MVLVADPPDSTELVAPAAHEEVEPATALAPPLLTPLPEQLLYEAALAVATKVWWWWW